MWRCQALAMRLWHVRVQRCQQALASLLVQGQTVGALGKVFLHILIALSEFFHQICRGVEVGDHFTLITVKTFLDVVQLTLRAVGAAFGSRRATRKPMATPATRARVGNNQIKSECSTSPSSINGFALR